MPYSKYKAPSRLTLEKILKGAVAGFVSTGPMTASMIAGWQLLPSSEKYPLPPREITEEITERAGIDNYLGEEELTAASLISHFGYGAMAGGVYALLEDTIRVRPAIKGILAGLAVWVGSYLGWLPAMRILSPATQHPWRRNLLMVVAHIVWGATLGMAFKKLNSKKQYIKY